MRLNKMRLAAAMMSAVMAASTMSTAVFAEDLIVDEDIVVEEQVEVADEATEKKVESVDIDVQTGAVTVKYNIGNNTTGQAKPVTVEPTCTEAGGTEWQYYLEFNGKTYTCVKETKVALGHIDPGEDNYLVDINTPDCEQGGTQQRYYICSRCGERQNVDAVPTPLPAKGHDTKGTPVITYSLYDGEGNFDNENVTISSDEKSVTLVDPTEDGYCYEVSTPVCSVCGKEQDAKAVYSKYPINATKPQVNYIVITTDAGSNIRGLYEDGKFTLLEGLAPARINGKEDKIALTDCSKDGYYYVSYYSNKAAYDAGNTPKRQDKVTIKAPHHVTTTSYVTKNAADQNLLKVTEKDGKVVLENLSCKKTLEYYEVETCVVENKEVSRSELKTLAPSDNHYNPEGAALIDEIVEAAKKGEVATKADYERVKANAEAWNVKYVVKDACEGIGTATVTAYCKVCGEKMASATINIRDIGHDYGENVVENEKIATCAENGSYDLVRYCKNCNKRDVVSANVVVKKLKHTFAKDGSGMGLVFKGNVVVDHAVAEGYETHYTLQEYFEDGIKLGLLQPIGDFGYNVIADAFDTCTVCGQKVYASDRFKEAAGYRNSWDDAVEIVDLKKDSNGNAGTITLNATYVVNLGKGKTKTLTTGNVTFPYYSSLLAYLDRNPGNALNGLHLDNDGVYRYYKDGEFQPKFTGIVEFEGGEFFVGNGVLCSGANGLNLYNGTWYMLSAGQIQRGYTGLALYDGEWFYLTNGVLDTNVNKLVAYDGEKFAVAAGRLLQEVNGLWQNPEDGEWYFLALGRAVTEYTGTATYDGKSFELVNGKLVD